MLCVNCLRELSFHRALGLRLVAHLAVCARCRAAYKQFTRLSRTARTLPNPASSVPVSLRNRVMDNLPELSEKGKQSAPPLISRRIALLLTAAVATGILLGPRILLRNSFAAEVQAAIRRTQTWHFTGWRLREGKKVRWEIWGQRTPYFYREQIGDELLLDDGKSRLRVISPSRSRIAGMVLKTASHGLPETQVSHVDPRASFMEGTSGGMLARLQEIGREGKVVTLESQSRAGRIKETAILTANRESKLPIQYTVRREMDTNSELNRYIASATDPKGSWTQAELKAEYDIPIPETARRAVPPAGYAVVDLTLPPAGLNVPKIGSGTKKGITMHAEVVERDASGNLHLRFHGWLGNQPVRGSNLPLSLSVRDTGLRGSIIDEYGTIYIPISMPPVTQYPDAPEMYIVPLEPIGDGHPLPQQLNVLVRAGAEIMEWEEENRSYRGTSLVSEILEIQLPLPKKLKKFDYDTITDRHVRYVGPRFTLSLEAAAKRALYYHIWAYGRMSSPEQKRQEIGRSLFWYNEAIREGETIPGARRFTSRYRTSINNLKNGLERLDKTGK